MNIGVLTVRDIDFHPNRRLSEAAEKAGHSLTLIDPYRMTAAVGAKGFEAAFGEMIQVPHIILPRQGSAMGDYGLVLIRQFELMGIPLVNGLEGVTIARNQFNTLQRLVSAGVKVPESLFLTAGHKLSETAEKLGGYPVIMKQVNGMGGDGVAKIETVESAREFVARCMTDKKGVVIQRFIPPDERKDLRIFVIGDTIAGAMALKPPEGGFKANIHQNGSAEPYRVGPELGKMALKAARACRLEVAGIDVIIEKKTGPCVIEVNYSPGFKGIESVTGSDIAARVVQYAAQKYENR